MDIRTRSISFTSRPRRPYGPSDHERAGETLFSISSFRLADLGGKSTLAGAAAPTWLGYLIAGIELFGGLAILIGIKTRWVAWAFVVYVIIITALAHPFWTMEGTARAANQANFYKNLAIMAAYLLLAITGAGRYSVDHRTALVSPEAAAY
jgi:uncharacterized membrane protein YphA (DoxX/SURF4 family)